MKIKKAYKEIIEDTFRNYKLLEKREEFLLKKIDDLRLREKLEVSEIVKVTDETALSELDELVDLKLKLQQCRENTKKLDKALSKLSDRENEVIKERLINQLGWEEVADQIPYSLRMLRIKYDAALAKLGEHFYGEKIYQDKVS